MIPTGKTTDKLVFGFTYCVIAALTIWGGTRLVNASIDTRFYRDYLQEWVVAMQDYGSEGRKWPEFSGGNHSEYMDALTLDMRRTAVPGPASNTRISYVYRMGKIGSKATSIFLLCFSDRIILYGLPEKTFQRIDILIDGISGKKKGQFTGAMGKDRQTYTGMIRL